jgi:outer membrane protein OmpA-like peptidoglycan-associated protein
MIIMRKLIILSLCCWAAAPVMAQNFRIQLAAYMDSVKISYFTDKGLRGVYMERSDNGLYQYFMGHCDTREQAEAIKDELSAKGLPNAVIIDLEAQRALSTSGCGYAQTYQSDPDNPFKVILFERGKTALPAEAANVIDPFVERMKSESQLELRIMGFTDNEGDAEANQLISAERARAVRHYLITKGIRPDRLAIEPYGEAEPQYANKDFDGNPIPENQRRNNRVMLKFKAK